MDKPLDLDNVRVYSGTKDDVIDAMSLIDQDVYMSDDDDFEDYYKYRLIGIRVTEDNPFTFIGADDDDCQSIIYKYFILAKDAKFKEEKEKELRPFKSIKEFFDKTGFNYGDIIHITTIDKKLEERGIFNGYRIIVKENKTLIYFGAINYSLEELKEYYLYFENGEWHPFGIEE